MTAELPIRPGFWNVPLWGEIGVYFVGIAAVAVLIWGIVRNWRLHRAAVSEPPVEKGLVAILKSVFYQPKNLETTGGRLHTVLAIGFFLLFLGTALATLDWDIGHYVVGTQFLQGNVYLTYKFVLDMAGVAVLLALFVGACRRYRKESKAKRDVKFLVAYVSLAVVVLTGFVVEGLRLAVEQPAWMHFSPVGTLVAKLFIAAGFTAETLRGVHVWLWTFHGLLSLAFIAAIPLTFYAHLYRTPAAVYRRKATTGPPFGRSAFAARLRRRHAPCRGGSRQPDASGRSDRDGRHLELHDLRRLHARLSREHSDSGTARGSSPSSCARTRRLPRGARQHL